MARTRYFKLIASPAHFVVKEDGTKVQYTKGQTVPSEKDLCKLFKNKFEEVEGPSKPIGRPAKQEEPVKEIEEDNDLVDITEKYPLAQKRKVKVFKNQEKEYFVESDGELSEAMTKEEMLASLKKKK